MPLFCCILLVILFSLHNDQALASSISIEPSNINIPVDGTFQIDVYINETEDLYGASVDMIFDPNIVKVWSENEIVAEGQNAIAAGTVFSTTDTIINQFNNNDGYISFVQLISEQEGKSVKEKTLLCSIPFKVINKGNVSIKPAPYTEQLSSLSLEDDTFLVHLSDSSGQPINYDDPPDQEIMCGEACFIATAAYGSYLDPHVATLRSFRDNVLLKTSFGKRFVSEYYQHSPPIANAISHNMVLKTLTRMLLTPVVYGIAFPVWWLTILMVISILAMIKIIIARMGDI